MDVQLPQIHRFEIEIKPAHIDLLGHVNNSVYLTLYEEARWDLIEKGGYGREVFIKTGLAPIILEVTVQFRRELTLGQKLTIETRYRGYERKVGEILQEMLGFGPDGSRIVYSAATFKVGLFDMKTRKLVSPTPAWMKAIEWSRDL